MCNYVANRLCCDAADRAMQVHGGLGYSRHRPFEHIYRHHRRYRITEGAEEIQMRRVAGYLFGFIKPDTLKVSPTESESMVNGVGGRIVEWVGPHVPEASDGILTSAGICEGFAGAGVSSGVLIFGGFAGLVAGTLAMGAVEYSKLRAERDQQAGQLARERVLLETAPDAELDELTQLYVSRGLSPGLARQVAIELTAHDALAAHAEAEYGISPVSQPEPLRDALAVSAAFVAGGLIPWLAMVLIPGTPRAGVTFVIVLLALALTGWVSARMSDLRSVRPVARMAGIGVLAMAITYVAGVLIHP